MTPRAIRMFAMPSLARSSLARRRLRLAMTAGTALASGVTAGLAGAQVSLPPPALPLPALPLPGPLPAQPFTTDAVGPGGVTPLNSAVATSSGPNALQVALRSTSTVLTWTGGFNIPANGSINFTDARAVGQGTQAAVLNRDVTGNSSQLLGSLTSASNIAVWVYNPNGIVVGPSARVNTGSLVLTTLAVDNNEFVNGSTNAGTPGTASFRLTGTGNGRGIDVQTGATITVTGGNRGLVLVAPRIAADGRFDASGTGMGATPQDVGFIVASDVTVNYAAGSPLSVVLNKGTAFGGATTQLVRGTVSGRNALFAIASQGSVTDALLAVDATVTTASSGTRGIVLSAGAPLSGVAVAGTANTDGLAGLTVTRALTSARGVLIGATGAVSVKGAVTAATDYLVTGVSVMLGGAGNVTQSANGSVGITATGGSITGASGLTLRSAADGSGTSPLSLATSGTSGGDIDFAGGSLVQAGRDSQSALTIRVRSSDNSVSLDRVVAGSLLGAVGSAPLARDGLVLTAPLSVGDVTIARDSLTLSADGITAGAINANRGLTLYSDGALSTNTITTGGDVLLGGAGSGTATGSINAFGPVQIARGGAMTLGGISSSGGDVTINGGAGGGGAGGPVGDLVVSGAISGRDITVVTGGAQQYGGAIIASGAIDATAGGSLRLVSATAARDVQLRGADLLAPLVTSGTGAIRLTATAGDARADRLSAAGDISVDATGTAAVVDNSIAGGAFRVLGTGVVLGSAGVGVMQAARGEVAISAGAGGIAGLGTLTLLANSDGIGAESLALSVSDPAGGIAFGPPSSLLGGRARQSDIAIRSGSASSPLTLGTVSARNLLGASGGDALGPGLTRDTALVIGNVGVTGPLVLRAAGISAGALSSADAVTLDAAGAITAGSIGAAGPVRLTGTGDTSIGGPVTTTGAFSLDRDGAVRLSGFTVGGDASLGAGVAPASITILGASTVGGALIATSVGAQDWRGAIRADAAGLTGSALTVRDVTATGGDLALSATGGALTAGSLTGRSIALSALGALAAGATRATAGDLSANGATVRVASASATGDIALAAGSAGLAFDTPVIAGGSLIATAPGDVSFAGATVGGALRVDTGGVASLAGMMSAGSLQLTGASVLLGTGARITGAGNIDLNATSGGITGGSGLVLASTGTAPGQFVRLQAAGPAGVAFAPDSSISAPGARVAVRLGDPASTLTLGAVTARGLVGLSVADGDPATQATLLGAASPVFGALTLTEGFAARATAGDLTAASLAVAGAGQGIDLAATGALRVGPSVSADGDVTLAAGSPLSLRSVSSGSGRVSVTSDGAVAIGTLAAPGGVIASGLSLDIGMLSGGAADLTASGGALRVGGGSVAAAMLRSMDGSTSVTGDLNVTEALTVASGADAVLAGQARAGSANVTGDAVRVADLATTDATTITARTGDVGGLAAGSGAVLAAGDLTVRAAGAATLVDTVARGGVTIDAGSISLTGASVGGDLRLTAAGDAHVAGPVSAGGNYALTAGAVTLGGVQSAGGAVTIGTRAGVLSGLAGLVLTSDTPATGAAPIALSAAGGGVLFDAASTLNGGRARQSDVTVDAGANAVQLGAVNARALVVNGGRRTEAGVATGALTLTDPLTILAGAGGLKTGAVTVSAGGATLDAGSGALATGTVTAAGPVTLLSGGTMNVGGILTSGAGGDVRVAAGGAARLGAIDASGGATVATVGPGMADLVLTGGLIATGDVAVASTHDIRAPFLTSRRGKVTVTAPNGNATGLDPSDAVSLAAGPGAMFAVTAGGDVRLGALTGGPVSLAARSISAASIDVGTNTVDLAATGGDLSIAGAIRAGAVSLAATGATTLGGALTASGAVTLVGMRGLSFGDITATSLSALSGGAVTGGTVTGGGIGVTGASVALTRVASTGSATLTATDGDLALGSASTAGDFSAAASGMLSLPGEMSVGGDYLVRGGAVVLGAATQTARGRVDITATSGDITGAAGLMLVSDGASGSAANTLVLDAAQGIALGGTLVQAGPGGDAALGLRAGAGQPVVLGRVEAASIGGVDAGHGNFSQPFTHAGTMTLGDVMAGRVGIALTQGDLRVGKVTATGEVTLAAAGALSAGDIVTRGAATLAGASIGVDRVDAGTIAITTTGDLTGRSGGRAALTSKAGDLTVDAGGQARLQSVASAGAVTLNGGVVDVAGQLAAARALLVKARAALSVGGAASAGGDATVSAGGAATLDALNAGGAASVTAAGLRARSVTTGAAMTLTSSGDLTLGQAQAGGAATLEASGLATLGQVVAGPSLTVLANDAELNGIQRAAAVTVRNRAPATRVLRLGDGTAADGFRLSNAELGRIDAGTLTLDGGTGAVELGTLALGSAAGAKAVRVFSTGQVTIDGALTGAGAGRNVTIGGSDASPTATASDIRIVATSGGGGRVLMPDADVELRGTRIAAGLATGFIDALAAGGAGVASTLVNNANSALYNANLGGGFYDQSAGTLLSARSLTVRYGDYALFQNTALPGSSAGVVLGGSMANPVAPALVLLPTGTGGDSLALFGTINGSGQTAAALLGPDVVAFNGANRATTRINGCLIGSGGGCLSTVSIQPTLQVFHVTASDVFGAAEDLTVPFDPVIGGGNEELLTGLDLLALESAGVATPRDAPVVEARP